MWEMDDFASNAQSAKKWFGKYRAFVRDNNDPERLGRIRLEIPAVLGSGVDCWSDWAAPCFPYGGNDDMGMFLVPDQGASVWAEFEGGNPQYPIWSGVWLAKSNPGEQPKESQRLCSSAVCKDCEDKLEHLSNRHDNLEHRKFHNHPSFYCPRMRVLFKSETGHTILVDDRDGDEKMRFIDRSGQSLTFQARVKPSLQTGNFLRRGEKDAENGDQIDIGSVIVDSRARVQLTDLCGQHILLEAWKDKEKVHIISRDKGGGRAQKILIDSTKGREKIEIVGLNGLQKMVIDSTKGQEKVSVMDKAGQSITMNSAAGRESIAIKDKKGSKVFMDGLSGNMIIKSTNMVLINP
jgi:hypothetical protein